MTTTYLILLLIIAIIVLLIVLKALKWIVVKPLIFVFIAMTAGSIYLYYFR